MGKGVILSDCCVHSLLILWFQSKISFLLTLLKKVFESHLCTDFLQLYALFPVDRAKLLFWLEINFMDLVNFKLYTHVHLVANCDSTLVQNDLKEHYCFEHLLEQKWRP